MKHLGDITKISGYDVPAVDCLIGGSPCQDLSVAGSQKGLSGERSGLFMEQVRLIREIRDANIRTNNIRGIGRYLLWENVPGAFSSNKGEDFRTVLEELVRVIEPTVNVPRPANGKWQTTGVIIGDGYSLAWAVRDAQFYGVPQRRRRICLLVDYDGYTAPDIIFGCKHNGTSDTDNQDTSCGCVGGESRSEIQSVSEGLRGNPAESREPRQGHKGKVSDSVGSVELHDRERAFSFQERAGCEGGGKGILIQYDHIGALSTLQNQYVLSVDMGGGKSSVNVIDGTSPTLTCTHGGEPVIVLPVENHPNDSRIKIAEEEMVQTLSSRMETGGNNTPTVIVIDRASYIGVSEDGIAHTVLAKGPGAVAYCISNEQANSSNCSEISQTLNTLADPMKVVQAVDVRNITESDINGTLQASAFKDLNSNIVVRTQYIVRRLTPLECERLQGYPDGWTNIGEWIDSKGKRHKPADAPRYKAQGNSIAVPCWVDILQGISDVLKKDGHIPTMASLFDGIGGFPLIWEGINGKGSCLWASEIEDFPIAVTERRFNEGEGK